MNRIAFLVVAVLAVLSQQGCAGCSDSTPGEPFVVDMDANDAGADLGHDSGVPDADTGEDTGGDDTEDTGPDADTTAEASIACQIRLASGLTAFGPPDSLSLSSADEPAAYAGSPGLQFDFVAATNGIAQATAVTLFLGGADAATANVVSGGGGGLGLAEVQSITLPGGVTSVWMEVKDSTGTIHKCNETAIAVAGPACGVSLAPLATGCTTEDARPDEDGFQMAWTVSNPDGTCDKAALRIDYGTNAQETTTDLVDLDITHAAEIVVTVASAEAIDGLTFNVTAIVEDSTDPNRHGEGLPTPYTADNVAPVVSIDTPTNPLVTLGDDPDQDPTNGIQVNVGGTVDPASTVAIAANGQTATLEPPQGTTGAWSWQTELSFTENGAYPVDVTATDACGNAATASLTITAFVTKGGLALMNPANGATLWAKDDLDTDPAGPTAMIYETTFTIAAEPVSLPVTFTVKCSAGPLAPLLTAGSVSPDAVAQDGLYLVPVAIDVAALESSSVSCTVSDDAVNPTTSEAAAFTVALPAPSLAIATPASGFVTSSTAVAVTAATSNLDGQSGLATVSGGDDAPIYAGVDTGTVAAADGLSATVHLTADGAALGPALADGTYTLLLDAADTFGNLARDQKASQPSVTVVLDTAAPALLFSAPDKPTLDPAVDLDADETQPGYQTAVVLLVQDQGNENGASVCLSANGADLGCFVVGADGQAVFPAVTLQPGANTLVATGTDVAGNVATPVTITPLLASDAPAVTIVDPADDLVTADPVVDFTISVADASGAAVAGATVTLIEGGVTLPDLLGTDLGGGLYSFTAVPIPGPGDHFYVAQADVGAAPGFSSPRKVTLKAAGPSVAFTAPLDGQPLNKASPECAPGSNDCVLTVMCATKNVEDGSPATLDVDCGAGATSSQGAVLAGVAAFPGIKLPSLKTCGLTCSVTDVLGETVTADAQVTVDRIVPVLSVFVKPGASTLLASDDLKKSQPGLQYVVQVKACAIEEGQDLSLDVTPEGGATETYTTTVLSPLTACDTVSFPEVTLPQGILTLAVNAMDQAGNPAVPISKVVQVVSEETTLRISSPADIPAIACTASSQCAAGGVCTGGFCARPWGASSVRKLSVIAFSYPEHTENLRVCSNDPAQAGGADCATPGGYHEVFLTTLTAVPKEVDLSALSDGVHTLVAEVKLTEDGALWKSSMASTQESDRSRRVLIDTKAPTVESLVLTSDTQPPTGTLNKAEMASGAAALVTASEAGSATIFVNGVSKGKADLVSLQASLAVAAADLPDGAHKIYAIITDLAGNKSAAPPSTPTLTPLVDTKAPSLEFTQPTASPIIFGAKMDVILLSDAIGQSVTLLDNGNVKGTAVVQADGTATFDHATFKTLTNGNHTLTATVADAAGNPGSATSIPLLVDTTAPILTFSTPASIISLADADDASADPGFQVLVSFSTTGASTWELKQNTNCNASFGVCTVTATVAKGAITNPGGPEPSFLVTLPIFKSPDYMWLKLEARDENGNMTMRTSQLTVKLTACQAAFVGLPVSGYLGNALCAPAGTDCDSVTLPFKANLAGACSLATEVQLFVDGVLADTQPIAGSTASFSRAFAHNTAPKLEAKAVKGATIVTSTGTSTVQVDLKDPAPLFSAKVFGAFTSPASGSSNAYGSSDDQSTQPGLQVPLRLDGTDDGFGGGKVTALTLTRADLTTAPIAGFSPALPISWAATLGQDLTGVTLEEGIGNTVTATVTDAAGNSAKTSFTYSADTTKPATPVLSVAVDSARRPAVTLSWTAVGDNGSTGGAAAAYDVRYSRSEITKETIATACDATKLLTAEALPAPAAPGTAETYVVTGPDARGPLYTENGQNCQLAMRPGNGSLDSGSFWFAVRVQDAAGNWSDIAVDSTDELHLRSAKISVAIAGGTQNANFDKRVSAIGDVNNDGYGDFALGGNLTHGFCIIYGAKQDTVPDLAFDPKVNPSGASWQCFMDATSTKAGNVKNIGDVNGDGLQDIGVGAEIPGSPVIREIRVYLGVQGGQIAATPALSIQKYNDSQPTKVFAGGGNFNGDANGLNPLDDIIVGSRLDAPGKVFVVPGSTAWPKATLDLTSADDRKAFGVVEIAMVTPPTNSDFGAMVAFVGNLLPDTGAAQFDDLVVGASEPTPGATETSQAVIVKGRATVAGEELKLQISGRHNQQANPVFDDKNTVQLIPDGGTNVFASECIPMLDVNGDGVLDLFIGHAKNKSPPGTNETLYLFDGKAIQAAVGGTVKLSAPIAPTYGQLSWHSTKGVIFGGAYQQFVDIGNFDDAPTTDTQDSTDIAFLKNDASVFGTASIRLNTDDGAALPYGTFGWISLELTDPYSAASQAFGNLNIRGVGDVNGDGLPDLVVGTNGSGYAVLFY